jgi:hypothetical protein
MQHGRDAAMTALILGFFASCWFGWAQERPPAPWRKLLIVGAGLSIAVALVGGVSAWRMWSDTSALDEPGAVRAYLIIVGIEFGVAAAGAAVIALTGHRQYLAPWICLVVGVHFVPLAPVLDDPILFGLGAVLTAVALAAVPVSRQTALAPSAVTGAGAGTALLAVAAWSAVSVLV